MTYFAFNYGGITVKSSINFDINKEQIRKLIRKMLNVDVGLDDITIITRDEFERT